MLSNSCYEETLLQATSRLLSSDLHFRLAKLLADVSKGIPAHSSVCGHCNGPIDKLRDSDTVIVFRYAMISFLINATHIFAMKI